MTLQMQQAVPNQIDPSYIFCVRPFVGLCQHYPLSSWPLPFRPDDFFPHGQICHKIKVKPKSLQKQIHEILCSKRQDRFSETDFDLVQNTSLFVFHTCFTIAILVRPLRDMRKLPQKCQKIAGCSECAGY